MSLRVAAVNLLKKLRFPASHVFPASTVTTNAFSGTQNHLNFDDTPYIHSIITSLFWVCLFFTCLLKSYDDWGHTFYFYFFEF